MWKASAVPVGVLWMAALPVVAQPSAPRASITFRYIASETVLFNDDVVPRAARSTEVGFVGTLAIADFEIVGGWGPAGGGAMHLGLDRGALLSRSIFAVGPFAVSVQGGYGTRRLASSSTRGGLRNALRLDYREVVLGLRPEIRDEVGETSSFVVTGFIGTSRRSLRGCQVTVTFISSDSGLLCPCDHPSFGIAFDGVGDGFTGVLGQLSTRLEFPLTGRLGGHLEASIAGYPYSFDTVAENPTAGRDVRAQTSAASFGVGVAWSF